MARPKKTEETVLASEPEVKVFEKVVEKVVEKKVVEPLFNEEDSKFLREFLDFTHALYMESNSVIVRTRLQKFNRLIDAALKKNDNC